MKNTSKAQKPGCSYTVHCIPCCQNAIPRLVIGSAIDPRLYFDKTLNVIHHMTLKQLHLDTARLYKKHSVMTRSWFTEIIAMHNKHHFNNVFRTIISCSLQPNT